MKSRRVSLFHLLQSLLLLLLLTAGAAGYIRVSDAVSSMAEGIKNRAIRSVEEQFHIRLEYGGISPSFLNSIVLKDIRIYSGDSDESFIRLDKLKLHHDLMGILFSDATVVRSIDVSGLDIDLDAQRDSEFLEHLNRREGRGEPQALPELSSVFTRYIRLKNWRVRWRDEAYSLQGSGKEISLSQQEGFVRFALNGSWRFKGEDASSALNTFSLDTRMTGTVKQDLSSFSVDSDFSDIFSNLARLEDQRLNISYEGETLYLTKIKDDKPYDLAVTLGKEELQFSLKAEDFIPSDLIYFEPDSPLALINPWLNTSFSGRGRFSLSLGDMSFSYDYNGALSLNNPDLPFPLLVDLDIEGDDSRLSSRKMMISSRKGRIDWQGEWIFNELYPEGFIAMEGIELSDDRFLDGRLILKQVDDYFSVSTEALTLQNGKQAADLKFLLYRNGTQYIFSALAALPSGEEKILFDGEILGSEDLFVQARYRVADLAVGSIRPFLSHDVSQSVPADLDDFRIRSEGVFSLSEGKPLVQVNGLHLYHPDEQKNLQLSAYYGNNSLDLYRFELNWDGNSLQGALSAHFAEEEVSIHGDWDLNDNKYLVNARYENGQLVVQGNHGVKVQMGRRSDSSFIGMVAVDELPLRWNGRDYQFSAEMRGRYGREDWEIYLGDSSFRWLNSDILKDPELKLTAYMTPGSVNIYNLSYGDAFSSLDGSGAFFFNLGQRVFNGSLSLSEMDLAGEKERYDAYAAYSGENLSLSLQIHQGLLDRFTNLGINGRIDSELNFEGNKSSPIAELSLNASELTLQGQPFAVRGKAKLEKEKFELFDLNIRMNNLYLKRGLGVYDLKDGSLVFSSAITTFGEKLEGKKISALETGLTLMADTGVTVDDFEVQALKDFNGRLRIHPVRWDGKTTFSSKTIDFSRKGSSYSAALVEDPQQFVFYDGESGSFRAWLKEDFPIAFRTDGVIRDDLIDLKLQDLVINLHTINYVMPKDHALDNLYTVFQKGSVMAGSATIAGTPGDPVFSADLKSRDLYVLTPYTNADIGETFLEARMRNSVLETNEFLVPIGDGGVRAKGRMTMAGWGIGEYDLDIKLVGNPGTPVNYNAYSIQGVGAVTGDLRLWGDAGHMNFGGTVYVNELVGSMGEETEIGQGGMPYQVPFPFYMDLDVVTGKNCLFILPNPELDLVRATAESGQKLNITVDTKSRTFTMTGKASIREGNIYYFDRQFSITEGAISFNEDQDTFNPYINIEAEIGAVDESGTEVTIYMGYRNPVLDEFIPYFRSFPAMQEEKIVSLLGQSLIPYDDESGEADVSKALVATGTMVGGSYGFLRPIESSLKQSLHLDNVTIKTEILENALADQLYRDNSSGTDSSYSMASYLDNTSIYFGKFAGDSLYLSAGVVVDYDQLYGLRSYGNGIELLPDLTIEMRTPFFMVYWNYNKRNAYDFYNTDIVPNNAFGLEWRYSY